MWLLLFAIVVVRGPASILVEKCARGASLEGQAWSSLLDWPVHTVFRSVGGHCGCGSEARIATLRVG